MVVDLNFHCQKHVVGCGSFVSFSVEFFLCLGCGEIFRLQGLEEAIIEHRIKLLVIDSIAALVLRYGTFSPENPMRSI
jgi:hypothetical protein